MMKIVKYIKNKISYKGVIEFYALFILLATLKLFIIWDNEILALGQPHDQLWFINSANHAYWFGTYTQMKYIHLPVFPLFIYFTHFIKVPLRIILELFYISSSFYLTYSLIKAGINKWLCPIIFALMIFHPFSMRLFNHTLGETFYSPLIIFSIANLIMLWVYKPEKYSLFLSILTGLSFALLWHTRDENILITAMFIFIFIILLINLFLKKINKKEFFNLTKKIILIPTVCIVLSAIFINSANFLAFGIFAPTELQGPGYKSAYTALSKIKPEKIIRFIPVTTETREKAYAISPAFRQLKPFLEDHSNLGFYFTRNTQRIDDEMAAGWFYWTLKEAVYQAGYKTAVTAEAFYRQVAKDIDLAIKEGSIESRPVFLNFVDPYFYKFLSYLPESFLKISRLFFDTQELPKENDTLGLPKTIITSVDEITNRRHDNINQNSTEISQGWLSMVRSNIQSNIWKIYGKILFCLTILALFFLIIFILTRKYEKSENLVIITLIILFLVFTRVMLFSILDIDSWDGAQPRYIFPVMPLYSTALIIIIFLGAKGLGTWIKAKRINKIS